MACNVPGRSCTRPHRALWWALSLVAFHSPARAHIVNASEGASVWLAWSTDPVVLVALSASFVLYGAGYLRLRARAGHATRALRLRQAMAFLTGWLMLLIALVSPLDTLGTALFSAHMVQHELLMIVAAPLLVAGRPLAVWLWALPARRRVQVGRGTRWPPVKILWRCITAPLAAWLLHAAALWLWHAPALFQAALMHPWIHTLQHTSFLASALLFWWSVLGRQGDAQPGATAMLSLFTTMVHTGALGALLTLAPGPWYPWYVAPSTALGFDPLQDQQMGGLVMWVPGGIAYVLVALAIAARWLSGEVASGTAAVQRAP